jgi:hypothetical protein
MMNLVVTLDYESVNEVGTNRKILKVIYITLFLKL